MAAPPAGAPDLTAVKEWLGLEADDTEDDTLLQQSLDAALAAVDVLIRWPVDADTGEATVTPDVYEATLLLTQRYAARRNSPEGVVGLTGTGGDFVAARLPSIDGDIARLLSPYLKMVVS